MVTLKDISVKCKCSVATVSKALNGMPDIGEETARHIRQVATQMGYTPNAAARTLKTNRSQTIGFERNFSTDSTDSFASDDADCDADSCDSTEDDF